MPDASRADAMKAAEDIRKALRTGQFDKAMWFSQNALARFPDNPHCASQAGRLFAMLRRDLDKARELCQSAVEAEPANPEFLVNLAWVHFMTGELAAVRATLAQALRCDKGNMEALRLLQRAEQAEAQRKPRISARRAGAGDRGRASGQGLLGRVKDALNARRRRPV